MWNPSITPNIYRCTISYTTYASLLKDWILAHKLCQVYDEPSFRPTFNKSPEEKYLAMRISAHEESSSNNRHQHYFASKVKLKQCRSQNLIPPCFFGVHIFHYANQCMCLCWSSSPHHYQIMAYVIPLMTSLRSFITDIAYANTVWAIAFRRTPVIP